MLLNVHYQLLVIAILFRIYFRCAAFGSFETFSSHHRRNRILHVSRIPVGPITDDVRIDLQNLFNSAVNATATRGADKSNQGHDSFRYEWGTWAVDSNVQYLMTMVDRVRVQRNTYDCLLGSESEAERYRVAGGTDWDCLLHVLPPGTNWQV